MKKIHPSRNVSEPSAKSGGGSSKTGKPVRVCGICGKAEAWETSDVCGACYMEESRRIVSLTPRWMMETNSRKAEEN